MNVSDFTLNFLADRGITEVPFVFGGAIGKLTDAFNRTKRIKPVCFMHEQGAGFAAEGQAKISGKPSAAIVTSGPGAQNLATSIANFHYDSIPGIFITGQSDLGFLRPNDRVRQVGFQEAPTVDIMRPITKYAVMITDPKMIRLELEKAYHIAQEGRPGPVLIDLPHDVQGGKIDEGNLPGFDAPETYFDIHAIDRQIDSFVKDLKKAVRPVVLVGAGVRNAGAMEEISELERVLKLPFFPTWNATDIVTSDSPFYGGRIGSFGGKGRNFGVQNSDLFLGVGTRLSGRIPGGRVNDFARGAKKYVVDIDQPGLEYQRVPLDEKVHSDARLFLRHLLQRLSGGTLPDFSRWNEKVFEWRDKYDPVLPEYAETEGHVHAYHFMRTLSQEMVSGDIVVGDCGGNIIVSNHAFETKKGQRTITNNGNSPMGFSFAGALGAWMASDKKHNVVCTIGDGGMTMNTQELQTMKHYGMCAKVFVLDNHCYGLTRNTQRNNFDGRTIANGPDGYTHPDFIEVARAYGIQTFKLDDPAEARATIIKVLNYKGPAVCVVENGDFDDYQPRVFGARPIEDQDPQLSRKEFRKNMIVDPLHGWENGSYKVAE